jgi:hypothetical protein
LVALSPAVVASSAVPSPVAAAPSSDNLLTAVRTVTQRVKPAVAQITNQQEVQTSQFNQPFVVPAGVGSGVIYDSQGHILTNNHVIEGAQQICALRLSRTPKTADSEQSVRRDPYSADGCCWTDVGCQRCRGGYVVVTAVEFGSGPPWCNRSGANVGEQVGDGDDVIAVWAGPAGTKPSAEYAALVAPLLTQEPRLTRGALIDDRRGGQSARQAETQFVGRQLTMTEPTLAAGVRAVRLAAMSGKAAPAGSAHALVVRSVAIVTQRVAPRSAAGVGAWKRQSASAGGRDERDGPGWRRPVLDHRRPEPDARPRPAVG